MSFSKIVNLGNSIIGVSILAMPYCFQKCGAVLSVLLILISGYLTILSCHFLLRSASKSRRRCFELIAYEVLGQFGRILVEIGLIGFLLGTCVAYFIMIGDLAPKIVCEIFPLEYSPDLRIIIVVILGASVALPMALLRSVDSLTSFSILSLALYLCLVLKLMFETNNKLSLRPEKLIPEKIILWDYSGLLTTFPIFSMAMSCQTSLFEIFDNSLQGHDVVWIKKSDKTIKQAVYMCSFVYVSVGLLGYMAFEDQSLHGNILLAFTPSLTTTLTKIGFIVTLLMSFPLCLFPCRTSVHSLFIGNFKKTPQFYNLTNMLPEESFPAAHMTMDLSNGSTNKSTINLFDGTDPYLQTSASSSNSPSKLYITDLQFRLLTVLLVILTICLSVMFPHIEFILGIIGSTAGTTVCFILPAFTFLKLGDQSLLERLLAVKLLIVGLAILVFCSYSTLLGTSEGD